MTVVVLHTLKWAKIPMVLAFFVPQFRKTINTGLRLPPKWMHLPEEVDRWEVIIILAVTLITTFVNLVIAVGVGVASRASASRESPSARSRARAPTARRYRYKLFATALRFHTHSPGGRPAKVEPSRTR